MPCTCACLRACARARGGARVCERARVCPCVRARACVRACPLYASICVTQPRTRAGRNRIAADRLGLVCGTQVGTASRKRQPARSAQARGLWLCVLLLAAVAGAACAEPCAVSSHGAPLDKESFQRSVDLPGFQAPHCHARAPRAHALTHGRRERRATACPQMRAKSAYARAHADGAACARLERHAQQLGAAL